MMSEDFNEFVRVDEEAEKARKRAEQDLRKFQQDLAYILDSDAGRNVIWNFLDKFGLFRETFCGESTHSTSYNQGRNSAAREILFDVMSVNQAAYLTMIEEKMSLENMRKENDQ
ncbi:hypothetical protein ABKY54_004536 [Vibrio harveyi]